MNKMAEDKKIKLRVSEASQDDAYKGIARIDNETMKSLEIKRGDVVIIKGAKETLAIVDRAYPADVGEGIIRIDGIIRKNAKTGVGEYVTLTKADIVEAKKISIAPVQENIVVHGDPEVFRRGLLGRAVLKGDIVVLGGVQRRRDLMSEEFGDDLNDIFGSMFGNMGINFNGMGFGGLQQMRFLIVNTNPNKPVVITENTEVVVNSKAIEMTEEKVIDVTYEDIGGLKEELNKIREMIELPLKHPEIFERLGVEPPKGILLYGPPGTGKTLLAKAVANESEANFIQIKGPSLLSMWVGESEKGVRKIFERARQVAPCIIFFDEIDSLAPRRGFDSGTKVTERVLNQLLAEMDGLEELKNVTVIGATNRPDMLDTALLRPGRFDRILLVPGPTKEGRLEILKIHTKKMPLAKDVNLDNVAEKTDGLVGADLENLCRESAMLSLREDINAKQVLKKHFDKALEKIRPSITKKDMETYQRIEDNYLRSAKSALTNETYLG